MKMIAVCEFENSNKQYEYLCEVPEDTNPGDLKFGVTYSFNDEATNFDNYEGYYNTNKAALGKMKVLFIRSFKPLEEQFYSGELQRLIIVFSLEDMRKYYVQKKKLQGLRKALEDKIDKMSIFDKIKNMNINDPDILKMAEDLKALMKE